jgi:hypothetical protein
MVRVKPRALRTKLDRRIRKAITGNESKPHYSMKCCDVEGVA